jgi:hypothetical protein
MAKKQGIKRKVIDLTIEEGDGEALRDKKAKTMVTMSPSSSASSASSSASSLSVAETQSLYVPSKRAT